MYVSADYFLSPEATVEVNRPSDERVEILIRDLAGSFQVNTFLTTEEARAFIAEYASFQFHSRFRFNGFTVFDKVDGLMDELKLTLEMI